MSGRDPLCVKHGDNPTDGVCTCAERDERTGAPMLDRERVQIFTVDGSRNALGQFLWGWQCFECGDEETAWRNASTARVAAENHEATCLSAPASAGEPRGGEAR